MVVQHNLTAINSNRMLGITTKSQSKSTEKLSSGYKINRAADDAAGLAISEKMRKQIRGLTQASANAQDGISAVQIAEGALTEVHDMIQRMSELAVKAANGTNSKEERDYIQLEVDELINEIDRVAETTKFNDIYLLKGSEGTDSTTSYEYVVTPGTSDAPGLSLEGSKTLYKSDGSVVTAGDLAGMSDADVAATMFYTATTVDADSLVTGAGKANLQATDLQGTYITASGGTVAFVDGVTALYLEDGTVVTANDLGKYFTAAAGDGGNVNWTAAATDIYTSKKADTGKSATAGDFTAVTIPGKPESTAKLYNSDGDVVSADKLKDYYDTDGTYLGGLYTSDDGSGELTDGDTTNLATYITTSTTTTPAALKLSLHVGADGYDENGGDANKISLEIQSMDATNIKVKGLVVTGEDEATAAIDSLKEALRIVSEQRAKLGAIQNRLEHTINNLDNIVENTTSAESQIRDTDMATEMVRYSNNNILAQAGQAMLAQSNQANQGVLSLLG